MAGIQSFFSLLGRVADQHRKERESVCVCVCDSVGGDERSQHYEGFIHEVNSPYLM